MFFFFVRYVRQKKCEEKITKIKSRMEIPKNYKKKTQEEFLLFVNHIRFR